MPWTQRYNARFAKPLLNQLIAIIQRDQAAALAVVNAQRATDGLTALKAISEFHKGPAPRTRFPWLTLSIDGNTFTHGTNDMTREQEARITLYLDSGQFDSEHAQDDAADYAWLLDMIVTSAQPADWITPLAIAHKTVPSGTTSPSTVASVTTWLVDSHQPQIVLAEAVDGPVMRISLGLTFSFEEN